jgi:uncharacterized protein (DUF2062 family)
MSDSLVDGQRDFDTLVLAADISLGIMPSPAGQSTSALEPHHPKHVPSPWRGNRVAQLTWRIIQWFSPLRAWRELKLAQHARKSFAAGLGLGVFIACVPVYGFQTILSLYAARRFSLHPLSVITGSQLSAPPVGPVVSVASIVLGHMLVFRTIPHIPDWHNLQLPRMSPGVFGSLVISWLVGGVLLGAALGFLTYAIAAIALRLAFARQKQTETDQTGL